MLTKLRYQRANKHLGRAIESADAQRLSKALAGGSSPNALLALSSESTLPALLHAIDKGLPEHVRLLLEAGAHCPPEGSTSADLLQRALRAPAHQLQLLTRLLQAGADPNDHQGAVFFSCFEQTTEATAQLLICRLMEHGGDVNCRNDAQQAPLELAMMGEMPTLTGTLISAGARLPDNLEALPCSATIKALAKRNAEDLEIRQRLQQPRP